MYSLVNNIESKVIAELKSISDLLDKIKKIAIENEDIGGDDFISLNDVQEYIEDYCDNLELLQDSEVNKFLDSHGIEVEKNEPMNYVELMMDNHKCIQWKDKQYYINDSLDLNDDEEKIYDVLVYNLHV
jgi:hypothetical protein